MAETASLEDARQQRLAVLQERYPRWHVWRDAAGWHGMRRGNFHQQRDADAPAHSVHEADLHLFQVRLSLEDQAEVPEGEWQR